jgi:hypothetical protein
MGPPFLPENFTRQLCPPPYYNMFRLLNQIYLQAGNFPQISTKIPVKNSCKKFPQNISTKKFLSWNRDKE